MVASNTQNVGAADARRRQLRIEADVLPAVGRGDEGSGLARTGEDDVARLVADEQRPRHAIGRRGADIDDADTVRHVIDDPHLGVAAGRHGDRLDADRDRDPVGQARQGDVVDLEPAVRRVDRE
ncbi:hypothetical protein [Nannocystis pusilla]|uniref:hypothetical protein n=1 Tax=Nannocystis pusilla TaxID=889268 RepID=UPI003DA3F886